MMAFTICFVENVVSLLKTVPLPEVVSVHRKMTDIVPEEIVDKVFHPCLREFSYYAACNDEEIQQTWLLRAANSNIHILQIGCIYTLRPNITCPKIFPSLFVRGSFSQINELR